MDLPNAAFLASAKLSDRGHSVFFMLVRPRGRILDKWPVDQDRETICTLPGRDAVDGPRLATGGQKLPDVVHLGARLVLRWKLF